MSRLQCVVALLMVRGAALSTAQSIPDSLDALRRLSQGAPSVGVSAQGGAAPIAEAPNAAELHLASRAADVAANAATLSETCRRGTEPVGDQAVVTLISNNQGYPAGAMAIAAGLEVFDSTLRRIVLVTPNVDRGIRDLLWSASWEVHVVDEIRCNQVFGPGVTPDRYDIGEEYLRKRAKWLPTCTKFHAWNLTFLKKVIFLDADTLLLQPIDDLVDHPSDFAAAPDTFPADQFNSGVMVVKPNATRFEELLAWNQAVGSAEGGDQCLLNDFFSEWFFNAWDNEESGKLPWIMNVAAAHVMSYKTLCRMQAREEPTIAHFVGGESKPWHYMIMKYQGGAQQIPDGIARLTHAWDQLYWLAKTNKLCAGGASEQEKAAMRSMLEAL